MQTEINIIQTGIVSGFILTFSHGITPGFFTQWLKSCALTWPIAFPTVTLVAPWVRRVVGQITT